MIKEYTKAQKAFEKAEATLTGKLDKLEALRAGGKPDLVPPARKAAAEAMTNCEQAIDAVEQIRREHWITRAKVAEAKLLESAAPLLEEIVTCRHLSQHAGVIVSPVEILKQLLHSPRVPFDGTKGGIPAEPLQADVLVRADEDLCYSNGTRATLERAQEHQQFAKG
ncbi:MAG: hypothetical protein DRR04_12965 [Gammaproteobacteria bacterium]|nr:MAG: hypothetical protein DRQ97_08565 [Gammaproteobacteria bacterium]RLA57340.1 MAG: hypothetical protein DRR04_12965 [Gammaproteobacteria bacterium]